jgi:hypothetical protein
MMASSKCVDAVDMMRRDPRLRLLPLGARALFVLLVDASSKVEAWTAGLSEVFRA